MSEPIKATELEELLSKREQVHAELVQLDKQIAQLRSQERSGIIKQIHQMLAEFNLSVADLGGGTKTGRTNPIKGVKIAAKYRDSATGNEWTGRGRQPKWVEAALAAGKTLDEFEIKN